MNGLATGLWVDAKRSVDRVNLNRRITISRARVSWCEFSEEHKQWASQLLVTAATLERGYQALRSSANIQVFQRQVNELGRLRQARLSDQQSFKSALRAKGAEPKVLEYRNEALGRLAERIERLAGFRS